MAGRPIKNTIDYFSHDVKHGKTIFTLESLYGNDGYAFWFKLLEQLGDTPGHCLNINDLADWTYFIARARVDDDKARAILKTLSDVGAIDPDLYNVGVVWSDNYVERLRPVYLKRSTVIPSKPNCGDFNLISDAEMQQSKVKESKGEESKNNLVRKRVSYSEDFSSFWLKYPRGENKKKAYDIWKRKQLGDGPFKDVMAGLENWLLSDQWKRGIIPHATTWLNGERWADEIKTLGEKDNGKPATESEKQSKLRGALARAITGGQFNPEMGGTGNDSALVGHIQRPKD